LEVEESDTIEILKNKIQERLGIPQEFYYLSYNGKPLYEGKTLFDYNIQ